MTTTPNFRNLTRESLVRAKIEIATNDPNRLRYAALELRDAMEALTYDRALAFIDEIPPEEYKTWQPRKLMMVLLDIDPSIGMTSTISIGREEEPGTSAPPENMRLLGTDHVFTLADLKEHYDAISSYLHMPSLKQVMSGTMPDPAGLPQRCENIIAAIERVLSSLQWNSTMGNFSTLKECMNEECRRPVRKRMPFGKDKIDAKCFECKAEYTITKEEGGARWEPKMTEVPCSTADCTKKMPLWSHEIRPGTNWRCRDCGAHNLLALSSRKIEDTPDASPNNQ